ncbi:MAG TPA: RagB/SusD family nutrient uptake outer membrane protein [Chitinophagaceae bacterium]
MKYSTKYMKWVLLLALPVAIVSTGCQKFLDKRPLEATLSDLNQGGVEGLALGLYGAIRNPDEGGVAWGHIPFLAIHSFRDDDAMKGSSASDGADWAVIYDNFQYSKDHWSTNIYYERKYKFIDNCNILIKTVDSLKLTDPGSMINLAEAKFFRALAYFDLVRTYGKVRKVDFPVKTNAQVNSLPKSDESVIYALIDTDLNFAEQYLPLNWNNALGLNKYPGRLTRGAAQTLHAKTLLYRQQWGAALNLLKQVIASNQYKLEDKYKYAYNEEGENGQESIFEIQAHTPPGASGTALSLYSFWGTSQGVRGSGDWDLGWGWNTPTQTLVDAYESGDPRKNYTILFTGQSDDPDHGGYGRTLPTGLPRLYWNKKVYVNPARQQETGDIHGAGFLNQRILRYADVLLMAAEAANEIGGATNEALAAEYVEKIRKRARENTTALPYIPFVSQSQMRDAIKKERRIEFAMEGERFFDLVRWGDATTVLGALGYQPRNKYLPLPQQVIDQSGGALVQNPDYP